MDSSDDTASSSFRESNEASSSLEATPSKRTLNPESPAFVPSNPKAFPSPSLVSKFRVDAPEFTPLKTTATPFERSTIIRNPTRNYKNNLLNPMESNLWMDPNIKDDMRKYNHWLLYAIANEKGGREDEILMNSELKGYKNFLRFDRCAEYDMTPFLPDRLIDNGLTCYRVRNNQKAGIFLLALFHNYEIRDGGLFYPLESYRRFENPFIAKIIESFTTHLFGRSDLVVTWEGFPGAVKLEEAVKLLKGTVYARNVEVWISQILWLFYSVHQNGLFFDQILNIKNLFLPIGLSRIVLVGFGVFELLTSLRDLPLSSAEERQAKDYENLIRIIDLLLATIHPRSESVKKIKKLLEIIPPIWNYSLTALGQAILQTKSIDSILSSLQARSSSLEIELSRQLEHDRLFRIISKLGFINERQSFAHDPNWSETGDRYILKLFRDHIFHCQDEAGIPIIDFAFVIDELNKLDASINEPIMLMSRDGTQCILATYADIRKKLELSYNELIGSHHESIKM